MITTRMRYNFKMRWQWRWKFSKCTTNYKCKSWCRFINCVVTFNAGTMSVTTYKCRLKCCTIVQDMKVVIFHATLQYLVVQKNGKVLRLCAHRIFYILIPMLSSLSACVQYWEGKKLRHNCVCMRFVCGDFAFPITKNKW